MRFCAELTNDTDVMLEHVLYAHLLLMATRARVDIALDYEGIR